MAGRNRGVNETVGYPLPYRVPGNDRQRRCREQAGSLVEDGLSISAIFEQDLRGPNGKPQGECGLGKSCALHAISLIFEQDLDGLSGLE